MSKFILKRNSGGNRFILSGLRSSIRKDPIVRDEKVSGSGVDPENVIEEKRDKAAAKCSPQPGKTNISEMKRNSDCDTAPTREEVLRLVDQAKAHLDGAGEILLRVEEHELWKVLGIETKGAFYSQYFPDYSVSYLTRLRDAARIRRTLGSEADGFKEGTLRPSYKLDADQQPVAFQRAKALAGGKRVTARHTKQAVDELRTRFGGTPSEQVMSLTKTMSADEVQEVAITLINDHFNTEQSLQRVIQEAKILIKRIAIDDGSSLGRNLR